jgi:hypothetical protein
MDQRVRYVRTHNEIEPVFSYLAFAQMNGEGKCRYLRRINNVVAIQHLTFLSMVIISLVLPKTGLVSQAHIYMAQILLVSLILCIK